MEIWASTHKTILAAALGTLGVPIRIEKSLDERTGKQSRVFHLGAESVDGKVSTSSIKSRFESGELFREDPGHPVVDISYAKQNRDRILDAVKTGRRCELVNQKSPKDLARTFYQTGGNCSFPGVLGVSGVLRTPDLNIVAAFARFGVPVLDVEGPEGNRKFILPAHQRLAGVSPFEGTVLEVWQDWRSGDLADEHPFAYACKGLINYGRLVRELNAEKEQILIRKPKSSKSAIVNPEITGKGMDDVRRFFLG